MRVTTPCSATDFKPKTTSLIPSSQLAVFFESTLISQNKYTQACACLAFLKSYQSFELNTTNFCDMIFMLYVLLEGINLILVNLLHGHRRL